MLAFSSASLLSHVQRQLAFQPFGGNRSLGLRFEYRSFASLSSLLQLVFVTLVATGAISLGYSLGFCAVGIPCSLFVILWAMSNPRTILLSLGAVISSSLKIAMWLFLAMLH
jgi:hypothetical protein